MTTISTPPIAAEKLFFIGNFPVTNAYLNSLFAVLIIVIFAYVIKRKVSDVPKGSQNFAESVLELMFSYADGVTGSREKTLKLFPMAGSLFIFIVVSNWIGILPGIGSIGLFKTAADGIKEFIPMFRSANADLNLTLAMALACVITTHIMGIVAVGFFRYANKFIKLGGLWEAVKSFSVEKILVAIIELGVCFLEVVSEVSKVLSLSLRLFGNIFAGEVLLTVLASLVAYIVPLPFMGLELLVGLIQALVFSMLILVYASIAIMPIPEHGHGDKDEVIQADNLTELGSALQDEYPEPASGV